MLEAQSGLSTAKTACYLRAYSCRLKSLTPFDLMTFKPEGYNRLGSHPSGHVSFMIARPDSVMISIEFSVYYNANS